jgi:hypothetical protein
MPLLAAGIAAFKGGQFCRQSQSGLEGKDSQKQSQHPHSTKRTLNGPPGAQFRSIAIKEQRIRQE